MLLLLSVALGEEAFFYISSYLKEKEKKRKSYVFLFKKKTKGKKREGAQGGGQRLSRHANKKTKKTKNEEAARFIFCFFSFPQRMGSTFQNGKQEGKCKFNS